MISIRTRHSLVQFLGLQATDFLVVLLSKHGAYVNLPHDQPHLGILNALNSLREPGVLQLLGEIAATSGDLRTRVERKFRFTERMHDLTQCLALDGYTIADGRLVQTDPSIMGAAPIEDDLVQALRTSGAPRALEIIGKIDDSADAFRKQPPDYNAALTNSRVALETLAADIASDVPGEKSSYDPKKWGEVVAYLRKNDEISLEEERGLAGVYGFLSPGAHRPVGIPEEQMTRLGRSFALNMCWFLLQNHVVRRYRS